MSKKKNDNTLENNKYRLCGDRNETVNHIISNCCELTQKEYKSRHDWVLQYDPLAIMQESNVWSY